MRKHMWVYSNRQQANTCDGPQQAVVALSHAALTGHRFGANDGVDRMGHSALLFIIHQGQSS